jgi:preprotein translocase subunit SecB
MPIKNVQLKHYFFPSVKVEANPSFIPPDDKVVEIDIKTNVNISANEEDDRLYQVQLDLNIMPKDGKIIPYNVTLKAIGILGVEGDSPDKEGIVRTQGAAILYSASREFLLGIMYRGPWPPILLPITIFSPQDISETDKLMPEPVSRAKKVK